MKHRLYPKLWVAYLLFGILSFVIICTFTQFATIDYTERKEARLLYRQSSLIAGNYASNYLDANISLSEFQSYLSTASTYSSSEIWLVDIWGNLLVSSRDPMIGINSTKQDYTKIADFDISVFGNKYYGVGTFFQKDEETLCVFSPITNGYKIKGYVIIHKPVSDVTKDNNEFMVIVIATVSIIYLTASLFLLFFAFYIYHPLRKITKAADSFAKGDFSKKIDVRSSDEIGHLANSLNYMATELDSLEEDQRKFVSNVSHDFRSPLTSIKGYVEAMQDGTIPVEMQDKYLNIILYETERLNKLTKSLLDLNQFGHRGIRLDIADFDINWMIKTTIQTFEGTCQKKNITFDLVLTGKELLVTGDMTKIQQVLYNLIDNATKFSKNGGIIKIETNIKNDKLFVSVKDSGIGIPSDSLSKIWDRFYKTDLSRGKDKRGTGLGLSIVKEIITAHNENINVVSTEGVGTEFTFTLPLSKKEE